MKKNNIFLIFLFFLILFNSQVRSEDFDLWLSNFKITAIESGISENTVNKVIRYYESLDKSILYDGNNYDNMYMTTFIQMIIDNLLEVKPIYINGGWVEIDSLVDLKKNGTNCG